MMPLPRVERARAQEPHSATLPSAISAVRVQRGRRVGAGDEGDPRVAGEGGGNLLAAGQDLVAVPAVGERSGVAGVVQHPQHGVVGQRFPVGLALAGSFEVVPGEGQAGGSERFDARGCRSGGLETTSSRPGARRRPPRPARRHRAPAPAPAAGTAKPPATAASPNPHRTPAATRTMSRRDTDPLAPHRGPRPAAIWARKYSSPAARPERGATRPKQK